MNVEYAKFLFNEYFVDFCNLTERDELYEDEFYEYMDNENITFVVCIWTFLACNVQISPRKIRFSLKFGPFEGKCSH